MNDVKLTKNHFKSPKNIVWEDVIEKISHECVSKTHKLIIKKPCENENESCYLFRESPTLVLYTDFFPNTINNSFEEIQLKEGIRDMHLYVSFSKNSITFGRHNDDDDILIVQSIGTVSYKFDDQTIYNLNPGDSLFIPKEVYHEPILYGPRVTLSCSWSDSWSDLCE
jgi:ribosomal protein L16 Arg81 hydroxylase